MEEVFKRVREAVEAAKARGEKKLDFGKLYSSWPDINLDDDQKDVLKKRLHLNGWRLENETKVMLEF